MKLKYWLLMAAGAVAALNGEAPAQTNTSSPANSNRSVRTETVSTLTDEQASGYSWLNLRDDRVNFGIRDTVVFPEYGQDTNNVDAGLEARIFSPLSIKLITNLNADNIQAFNQKVKLGAKLDHKWLRLGFNYGESDTERLVLPYAQLNIKGLTLFVSHSDYKKDQLDLSRVNLWGVLDFKKFAIGGGTSGIDNNLNYAASVRINDLLGYGIQTHAFFNHDALYKSVLFATRDKYPTSKLAGLLMPIFTGADGMNNIINEQNLLGTDTPMTYECLSDPNDHGVWIVYEKDNFWFVDAAYMLPRPLTNGRVKPMLIARYTRNTLPEQEETTAIRLGGSLIVPINYKGVGGQVQLTAWQSDNLDDHLRPDTSVHLVGSLRF